MKHWISIIIGVSFAAYMWGGAFFVIHDSSNVNHIPIHSNEHLAVESCQVQSADCQLPIQKSVECVSHCLSAASPVNIVSFSLPFVFALLVTVMYWFIIPQVRPLFQWQRQFWYFPHYLFNTVILRE
ncbi:MAG: hypothetical protein HYV32_05935 [Candidatus Kerfeldbacteria bacterium]|nr:hypothetical protein [Candidatus Kerfeldbacteria bacterium]